MPDSRSLIYYKHKQYTTTWIPTMHHALYWMLTLSSFIIIISLWSRHCYYLYTHGKMMLREVNYIYRGSWDWNAKAHTRDPMISVSYLISYILFFLMSKDNKICVHKCIRMLVGKRCQGTARRNSSTNTISFKQCILVWYWFLTYIFFWRESICSCMGAGGGGDRRIQLPSSIGGKEEAS